MKIDFCLDQDALPMFPDQLRSCENRFYNQKYQKHHHNLHEKSGGDFEIFFIYEKWAKIDLLFTYKI